MIQALIAIALWCGQPMVIDSHTLNNTTLTVEDVNACRDKILKCINGSDIGYTDQVTAECIEKTKLGEK